MNEEELERQRLEAEAAYIAELEQNSSALQEARRALSNVTEQYRQYATESEQSLASVAQLNVQLLTSIANARRDNVIAQGRVEVATAERDIILQRIQLYTNEIGSAQRQIDANDAHITELAETAMTLSAYRQSLIPLIQASAQDTEDHRESMSVMTSWRDAVDARIASLNAAAIADEWSSSTVTQALQAYTDRMAAGETLSDAEETAVATLLSEYAALGASLMTTREAIVAENVLRDIYTDMLIDQNRLLDAANAEAERLADEERDVSEEFDDTLLDIRAFGLSTQRLTAQQNALRDALAGATRDFGGANINLANANTNAQNTQLTGTNSILRQAAASLRNIANHLKDIVDKIRETQQEFGLVAGTATKLLITNAIESVKSFFSSITSLGKATPVTREEIAATQGAFQGEFGGVLDSKAAESLAEQAKEMGVTGQAMANARRVFMTQSGGSLSAAIDEQEKFVSAFTSRGLTSKDAFASISRYSDILAKSGARFAASFAKAAVDAKKIGVDLSKVDQIGDNIIGDFEGFLENSATLGAMGFNIDANKLAQLAEIGDTGALFQQLRSELAASGKDITNLRRSEQLALSQTFGMSIGEFQRMAAGGEAGSGEKTIEELAKDDNAKLTGLVNLLEGILPTTNILLGLIAAATAATALSSGAMGAIFGVGLAGLGTALAGVGIATGAVAAGVLGWSKFKEGQESYAKGDRETGIRQGAIGGAGMGILGGAATGAALGAPVFGIGAILGAILGGLAGAGIGGGIGSVATMMNNPSTGTGKADGGLITGAGTSKSDTIPTMTSPGEYVVQASAVQGYGIDFLNAINNQKYTPQEAPTIQNNIQVDVRPIEKKLDAVIAAITNMGIHIDGDAVGRVLANGANGGAISSNLRTRNVSTY